VEPLPASTQTFKIVLQDYRHVSEQVRDASDSSPVNPNRHSSIGSHFGHGFSFRRPTPCPNCLIAVLSPWLMYADHVAPKSDRN
jgi:hypothetical protein